MRFNSRRLHHFKCLSFNDLHGLGLGRVPISYQRLRPFFAILGPRRKTRRLHCFQDSGERGWNAVFRSTVWIVAR
jgi:hypothetical protein